MRFHTLNLLALVATATSFTIPQQNIRLVTPTARVTRELMAHQQPKFDSCGDVTVSDQSHLASSTAVTISTSALLWAASAQAALADSPDWGLFEGRIGSLLHPLTMLGLLGFSISTALLGFNWKRQRTMGDEISALKKTLPDLQGAKSVSEALAAAKSADPVDQGRVNALQASMSIENEIDTLQKERKDLAAANPRDQHFSQGSLLAFLGTAFAIEVSFLLLILYSFWHASLIVSCFA
jgi:hypothetical protein